MHGGILCLHLFIFFCLFSNSFCCVGLFLIFIFSRRWPSSGHAKMFEKKHEMNAQNLETAQLTNQHKRRTVWHAIFRHKLSLVKLNRNWLFIESCLAKTLTDIFFSVFFFCWQSVFSFSRVHRLSMLLCCFGRRHRVQLGICLLNQYGILVFIKFVELGRKTYNWAASCAFYLSSNVLYIFSVLCQCIYSKRSENETSCLNGFCAFETQNNAFFHGQIQLEVEENPTIWRNIRDERLENCHS